MPWKFNMAEHLQLVWQLTFNLSVKKNSVMIKYYGGNFLCLRVENLSMLRLVKVFMNPCSPDITTEGYIFLDMMEDNALGV